MPFTAQANPFAAYEDSGIVILNYHRIGEDNHTQTNITADQFVAHMQELKDGDYAVISLPDALGALKSGKPVQPKTIVLTFDGGYASFMRKALPLLEEKQFPFTLFFSPGNVQSQTNEYLTEKDIRLLSNHDLATLGLHPASYSRIYEEGEVSIRKSLNAALNAFRRLTENNPRYFAFPFGEYTQDYQDIVAEYGFAAALTQHAGMVTANNDVLTLPRFVFTENYADRERFLKIVNALPFPVSDILPAEPVLTADTKNISFTLPDHLKDKTEALDCFYSGFGKAMIEKISETRLQIALPEKALEEDRIRLTCTMADGYDETGEMRWRWLGYLMTVN